ncbi:MAG: thioredoxin domain-containing protein [Terracidiphilus sp.]|jgi:protein-disulfide isomerase
MPCSFALVDRTQSFIQRTGFLLGLGLATMLMVVATHGYAQFGAPSPGTPVHDSSSLKPPAGARVAIVEFADMECPMCGKTNPNLKAAAATYHIPWVRHDFPLPMHAWSFTAAVNARWFDANKGKAYGDEYRDEVFANQASLGNNPDLLRQFTEKFAKDHGIKLPFAMDPEGKLAADVTADYALGQRVGIEHTPTIFIVTANSKGAPFIEVQHPDEDLYRIIDQAIADTRGPKTAPTTAPAKKPVAKKIAGKPASKPTATSVVTTAVATVAAPGQP